MHLKRRNLRLFRPEGAQRLEGTERLRYWIFEQNRVFKEVLGVQMGWRFLSRFILRLNYFQSLAEPLV